MTKNPCIKNDRLLNTNAVSVSTAADAGNAENNTAAAARGADRKTVLNCFIFPSKISLVSPSHRHYRRVGR
jgi:hypothetical protein